MEESGILVTSQLEEKLADLITMNMLTPTKSKAK